MKINMSFKEIAQCSAVFCEKKSVDFDDRTFKTRCVITGRIQFGVRSSSLIKGY